MRKKIVIAGGTGFLGTSLIERWRCEKVELIILTRKAQPPVKDITYLQWDGKTGGDWEVALDGSLAVINFTGKSVNCRYSEKNKREIIDSRVNATLAIGRAIQKAKFPPELWINGGSEAIFGNGGDKIKDENSREGTGFSSTVCKHWEQAFNSMQTHSTRKALLRMGIVFQRQTGLLQPFVNMVKCGLGGKIGTGRQYISWIHEEDFVNVIEMIIKDQDLKGVIHCSSPFPVTNKHFMKALRTSLNCPFGLPNPAFLIKIGAVFINTEAELILTGRRVVSRVLEERKFAFRYPHIESALDNLVH